MSLPDPRMSSLWTKTAALFTVNIFVYMGNMYSSGLATAFDRLGQDLRLGNSQLSDLINYSVLSMGLANLFWMPFALCFGKRPVVIVAMAMFLGGIVWSCVAPGYNSLLGSRVFASFGYGAIESLGPSILADMFREHYYATAMAMYALSLSAGSQIGPLIAGYLVSARGWRWFFILCAILAAVNLLMAFFFLPETLFEPRAETDLSNPMDDEKHTPEHLEETRDDGGGGGRWRELLCFRLSNDATRKGILKHWLYVFLLPLPMILIPGVFIASIMYGVVLGGVVAISTLAPALFTDAPYNFSSAQIGLFFISGFIGISVAYPIAGPLTDIFSGWMCARNNNIHKPEHRIPALLVPFLICPPGLIVFGCTIANNQSYVYPAIGTAMSSAALTMVPSVMLSYVVESYPLMSGEGLVLINTTKNVVAFGISESANSWLESDGQEVLFENLAAIQWAVLSLALPLFFLGPWIRSKTGGILA